MRVVIKDDALPRLWQDHPRAKGIVAEAEIRLSKRSRLRAKLLVFEKQRNLKAFWRDCLGTDLGPGPAYGCVHDLGQRCEHVDANGHISNARWLCDKRYYCVIGLLKGYTTRKIGSASALIAHESVHAAFAFERRRRRDIWPDANHNDEENIAYPTGEIASAINRFMHDQDLY